jgi:hypothetical protein
MLDRPFESRMAEIDVELRNLGEEMLGLGLALRANERCSVDALSKWEAIAERRQTIIADFAMLRADVRRAQ